MQGALRGLRRSLSGVSGRVAVSLAPLHTAPLVRARTRAALLPAPAPLVPSLPRVVPRASVLSAPAPASLRAPRVRVAVSAVRAAARSVAISVVRPAAASVVSVARALWAVALDVSVASAAVAAVVAARVTARITARVVAWREALDDNLGVLESDAFQLLESGSGFLIRAELCKSVEEV